MYYYQKIERQVTKRALRLTRSVSIQIAFVLAVVQNSRSPANANLSTPTAINTIIPITHTLMPIETTLPASTPSPTPVINGIWNDEPPLLIPRSAHAVASSDSAIYALAGTDDHGKPVLEVEVFDGKEWKIETTLPGRGLNAPTTSRVGQRLYVVGGFTAVTNVPTDELQVYDLQTQQWSIARQSLLQEKYMSLAAEAVPLISGTFIFTIRKQIRGLRALPLNRVVQPAR